MLVIKPSTEKLKRAAEQYGAASPEAGRYARRLSLATRLDLVVLFAVVAVMVSKPYSGETGTLVGLAAGVVAACLVLAWTGRPARTPARDVPLPH